VTNQKPVSVLTFHSPFVSYRNALKMHCLSTTDARSVTAVKMPCVQAYY